MHIATLPFIYLSYLNLVFHDIRKYNAVLLLRTLSLDLKYAGVSMLQCMDTLTDKVCWLRLLKKKRILFLSLIAAGLDHFDGQKMCLESQINRETSIVAFKT